MSARRRDHVAPANMDGEQQDRLSALEDKAAARHDELRREKARSEAEAARRAVALRDHIDRAEARESERAQAMGADVVRRLARLERLQRDTFGRRSARRIRGLAFTLALIVTQRAARHAFLQATHLLIDPPAARTWRHLFDTDDYLERYPDVARANIPASLHYLMVGYREQREPSPDFSGVAYLEAHADVRTSQLNPLAHYALRGRRERRATFPRPADAPLDGPALETPDAHPMADPWVPGGGQSAGAAREPVVRVNPTWPDRYPLVTVVIPAFGYGHTLRAAIDSVLEQTWQDVEIIVVESAGADPASTAAVRAVEATRPPRTTFLYRTDRSLVGDNRNYAIERGHGRYVVCLDADDTLESVYLEVALYLAEAHGYDLVYPSVRCVGDADHVWPVRDTTFEAQLEQNSISVASLFRRSAWLEAGGYRDWGLGEKLVPEDWAFWTRLLGLGSRPKSIAQPLLRHYVHEGSMADLSGSTLTLQREAIRLMNEDLLESIPARDPSSTEWRVLGPHRNLLAREPSSANGGSVLVAIPDLGDAAVRVAGSVAAAVATEDARLLVVVTDQSAEDDVSVLPTEYLYALPSLFSEPHHREAFLLFLVQRYRIRTLVLGASQLAVAHLASMRQVVPDVGIVRMLDASEPADRPEDAWMGLVDVAIVPSEEHRRRLLEAAVLPASVRVMQTPVTGGQAGRALRQHLTLASRLAAERTG